MFNLNNHNFINVVIQKTIIHQDINNPIYK